MENEKTIDQLLESLDSEVFTPDLKIQMKTVFDKKLQSLVEAKSDEFEKQIKESSESYDKKIEEISKEFEVKQEKELKEFQENIIETLDSFLTRLSEEVVTKNEQAIIEKTIVNEAIEVHKIFDNLMETYHFNFKQVPQKLEKFEADEAVKAELTKAVNESIELKKQLKLAEEANIKNQKSLIISEFASRLDSVVDKHRFNTLAESFVFIPTEKTIFEKRLETLLNTVAQKKTEKAESVIKESVNEQEPKHNLKEGLDEKTGNVIKEEEEAVKNTPEQQLKKQMEKY